MKTLLNNALKVLQEANNYGIEVFLDNDKLKIKVDETVELNDDVLNKIKENKDAIISLLADSTTETLESIDLTVSNGSGFEHDKHIASANQERVWFIDKVFGSSHYHIPCIFRLKGNLVQPALEFAFQALIHRHEILRTTYLEENGQLFQIIGKPFQEINGKVARINAGSNLEAQILQLHLLPFNLEKDFPVRLTIIDINDSENLIVFTIHHIASDGFSTPIIINELIELYNSCVEEREPLLSKIVFQYKNYAVWQQRMLEKNGPKYAAFWTRTLADVQPLALPLDYDRPKIQSTNGRMLNCKLDVELMKEVEKFSINEGVTPFITLMAAFQVLLFRLSGSDDICIGTPIANRTWKEFEHAVGFYANTLPLRVNVPRDLSFKNFLHRAKEAVLSAATYAEFPFEKIIEALGMARDASRTPIFQTMFSMDNLDSAGPDFTGLKLMPQFFNNTVSKFDLTVVVAKSEEHWGASLEYCTDLFTSETATRFMDRYKTLLQSIIDNPSKAVSKLNLLSKNENNTILNFCGEEVSYPRHENIITLLNLACSQFPDNVAVSYLGQTITYDLLSKRSNQLAHVLIKMGVTAESFVPICAYPSIEMIIGILAILKAGAAYVPIDPTYPTERIQYILDDVKATIALASYDVNAAVNFPEEIICIELDIESFGGESSLPIKVDYSSSSLAYVIYTSGSTGRPKGVMIEHRNVVRLFKTEKPLFDFNEQDVWTLFHSFSFDFSVWEIFGALFYGGKLVIIPKEFCRDYNYFASLICSERVTILNQTPSSFYVLQEVLTRSVMEHHIRKVIFGGEALNPSKLTPWLKSYPKSDLINMYGITETTVHVTYLKIEPEHLRRNNSVIGKPIPTLACYVLDASLNLVPLGVVGELYVAGEGLAKGYLNQDKLTNERFISNPFVAGSRLYKTGDLARWQNDGNLEYIGRIDEQVKIRGFRIELGEIEQTIISTKLATDAIVIAKADKTVDKRLIAYIRPGKTFDRAELYIQLRKRLPDYMIPNVIIEMSSFPLTINGKIDKSKLPNPTESDATAPYALPRTAIEQQLVETWQEVLNVDRIGIYDNFFEIGGHSLLLIRMQDAYRAHGFDLSLKNFFEYSTVAEHSCLIEDSKNFQDPYASPRHLLLLNKSDEGSPFFIIPGGGGGSGTYSDLAKALNGKVYAIEMLGFNKDEQPLKTIKDIAHQNIKWVKEIQPNGPFRFIGHSFGAFVLYEMIRQLEDEGQQCELAVMLDMGVQLRPEQAACFTDEIKVVVDMTTSLLENSRMTSIGKFSPDELKIELKEIDSSNLLEYTLQLLSTKLNITNPSESFILRLLSLQLHNAFIGSTFKAQKPLATPITLVKAEAEDWRNFPDCLGWSKIARIQNLTCPGDHSSMVEKDNAKVLAQLIHKTLYLTK